MFTVDTFTGGIAQTNGHLLRHAGGSLLVDAPEGTATWLKSRQIRIDALFLTHQHFDHVQDAAEIQKIHGCPVFAFASYARELTLELLFGAVIGMALSVPPFVVDHVLQGKDSLFAGRVGWTLLHVPGHSPDSLCFYQEEWGILFGGDVLFMDGIGRTDFPGGSTSLLLDGIRSKLLPLPDPTQVFPGHGPATTVGRERGMNPYLQ